MSEAKNIDTKYEKLRNKIKRDLLKQLKENNASRVQRVDLVNDYMSLWDVKNKLIEDIDKRGVAISWNNGGGQGGMKKNESITELAKVNGQMLKILSELDLKPKKAKDDANDITDDV